MQSLYGKEHMIKDLKRKIRDLETENDMLQNRLTEMIKERDYMKYCLDETRKSFSYRLGYLLTAIPRKIKYTKRQAEKEGKQDGNG